jgi:hypothetical protein
VPPNSVFLRNWVTPRASDFVLPRIPMGIESDLGEVAYRFILNGIIERSVSPSLLGFKSRTS